jgi:diguanylate cyclase (GGDEF)-like protein
MQQYTSATMISTSIYFNSIQSSNYSINSIIQVAILCYFFLAIIVIYKIKFWSDQIAMEKRLGTICEPKMTDELTGLPNRTYFCEKIRQDLLTSIRGENAYFLFIDIDQFKVINDTMGHSAGDLLINSVSSRLTKILRENDGITRYGGDEFLIVLRNLKDTENVNEISERILHSIREPFYINHYSVNVTCSMGVSRFPTDGKNIEMLIKKADDAMYTAKNEGKNRCVLYSKNLDKSIQLQNIRIDLLQQALKRNEFELYYQPQVHINTKKIIGTEGFIRWHHPEKGILYPKDFIPLAEKSGLINEISEWVLQAACKQNKYWQEKGILNAPVAVNLSMVEINGTLLRRVSDTLNRTALDPKYLELEIPERLLLNNISEVKGNIEQLKKLGVKLTIGNFGAEYLPFNLLKQFPIDRIKIPINYIYGNEQDSEKERYISMILGVVQNLGFEVIAQGVETQKQMDFLKTQFCQSVQGYHICWPMRANEIEGFFLTKKFIYASTVK